jgi:hypothetical protein
MTTEVASPTSAASAAALAQYEHLRRHVLGEGHDTQGAPGLALVMRGGMRACLVAAVESADAARMATATCAEVPTEIETGLRGDIARVMVAMALKAAAQREAHA